MKRGPKQTFNRTWSDGDVGFVEIVSPKYGKFVCKVDSSRLRDVENIRWSVYTDKYRIPRYAMTSAYVSETKKTINSLMHILLFPDCPIGMVRDHINGDGLDNRSANVRFVTPSHNSLNRKRRKSKIGVGRHKKGGFSANLHLGRYATEDEAHEAWKNAYVSVHGSLPECARG